VYRQFSEQETTRADQQRFRTTRTSGKVGRHPTVEESTMARADLSLPLATPQWHATGMNTSDSPKDRP
jgi:hypothetical protein